MEQVVAGGAGLARVDGRVCLIPYGLPGDRLRLSDVTRRRGVLHGLIAEVLEPSPDRVETSCPVFGRCGGCSWLHFAYPAQAEWKRRIVEESFARIAKIDTHVNWLDDPELHLGYRTRAAFHAKRGAWGFYGRGSHKVIDIAKCPLCHERVNEALGTLRRFELDGDFEVTVNPDGGETLLWAGKASPELRNAFPLTNTPKDKGQRFAFGFDGIPVVNGGFSQASLLLNRLLMGKVKELAQTSHTVLDLYCGSGNLSLGLAAGCDVVGIDHHRPSIDAAAGAGPGRYVAGDERDFFSHIAERGWDTIILDPPRQGARAIMPALAESRARQIVYVSCDPPALARDSKTLLDAGWRPREVTVIDMFPQTPHIETVACFSRDD